MPTYDTPTPIDLAINLPVGAIEIFASDHGQIRVGTVSGHAVLKASHGSVQIDEVGGDLDAKLSYGDLEITRAQASVSAKTAYGSIQLREVSRGSVQVESGFGQVTIGVKPGVPAWLDLSSKDGHVRNELDDVDLAVSAGTVTALLGPNGAGKTTAVHILSTLLRPDGGMAFVNGCDVVRDQDGVRAVIGRTGQFSAVDKLLNGEENLLLMARLRHLGAKQSKTRVAELLEQFDLVDAARKPHPRSGRRRGHRLSPHRDTARVDGRRRRDRARRLRDQLAGRGHGHPGEERRDGEQYAPRSHRAAALRQRLRADRLDAGVAAVVRAVPALHSVHRDNSRAAARHPTRLEPRVRHRVVRRDRGRQLRLVTGALRAQIGALDPCYQGRRLRPPAPLCTDGRRAYRLES